MIDKKRVEQYCKEDISLIENYDEAINSDETYVCHHRNGIVDGVSYSAKYLKDNDLYYDRPASELIFLTKSEHTSLHNNNMSEETIQKMSETRKGRILTEEHKQNLSESMKGKFIGEKHPMYGKTGDKNPNYGKHWYTNGAENVFTFECPDGFYAGRTIK